MATTAEPPVQPPVAPAAPPAQSGSPVPVSSGREIKVTAPTEPVAAPAPKPGTAKARMAERLRGKAAEPEPVRPSIHDKPAQAKLQEPAQPPTEPAAPAEPEPTVDPFDEPPVAPAKTEEKPKEPETPAEPATPAAADDKKGKQSPWKLVNEYKSKVKELERQVIEARNTSLPAKEKHELTEALKAKEARLEELENEIRFVNYQKSEEFKTKYQQPYEKAWNRAMKDVRELTVTHPETGETRVASDQDLLELVQLPLGQARAVAEQKFGEKFANDVLVHRREIRALVEAQQDALKEAREKGSSRETETQTQQKQAFEEAHQSTVEVAREVHEKMLADPNLGEFLKPVEGDEEINGRLTKGYELVDKWWQKNPIDPKLSPEDRAEIVRHQVAIRNRAAAFGATMHRLQKAQKQIQALSEELEQFKASEPKTGGTTAKRVNGATTVRPAKAWDRLVQDLQSRAK